MLYLSRKRQSNDDEDDESDDEIKLLIKCFILDDIIMEIPFTSTRITIYMLKK